MEEHEWQVTPLKTSYPLEREGTRLNVDANMRLNILHNSHHTRRSMRIGNPWDRRMSKDMNGITIPRMHEIGPERLFSTINPLMFPSKSFIKINERDNTKAIRSNRMVDTRPEHPVIGHLGNDNKACASERFLERNTSPKIPYCLNNMKETMCQQKVKKLQNICQDLGHYLNQERKLPHSFRKTINIRIIRNSRIAKPVPIEWESSVKRVEKT
ncbi:hypothetical protein M9H77_08034 [Catharanthus roseus]|uniref:Uncharacterized protein n=1 Tax=Catharanthus roseus TaxID=4058 RepID=A0ACC0BWY0_CATRO|nr:hypothetical protein M9H77_08034 [Catharanthus roseus]